MPTPTSGWKQLRLQGEGASDWNTNLFEILAPLETVEAVFISSYEAEKASVWGGLREHSNGQEIEGLVPRLRRSCPRLNHVTIAADWQHTNLHESTTNPYQAQEQTGAITVTLLFPHLRDATAPGEQRRAHGIHHTKVVMVRHASHLKIGIATCNLDNWGGQKCGEAVWVSPELAASPVDVGRLLPSTDIGRRCGHSLYQLMVALTATKERSSESYTGADTLGTRPDTLGMRALWAESLAAYRLEDLPANVHIVASIPGDWTATPEVPRGAGVCESFCLDQPAAPAPKPPSGACGEPLLLLGHTGGALAGWDATAEHCAALKQLVAQRSYPLYVEVSLEHEPDNPCDAMAIAVYAAGAAAAAAQRVGYVPARNAACLTPLLSIGAIKLTAHLHCVRSSGHRSSSQKRRKLADGASSSSSGFEGAEPLPDATLGDLRNTRWYVDVQVWAAEDAPRRSPSQCWLALAAGGLRCNFGLHRLREILHGGGDHQPLEWRDAEQTAFASWSPCIGQRGFEEWIQSLVSAVRNDEDVAAIGAEDLMGALEQAEVRANTRPPPADGNAHMCPRHAKHRLSPAERLAEARWRNGQPGDACGGLRIAFPPQSARDMLYLQTAHQAEKIVEDDDKKEGKSQSHAERMLTSGLLASVEAAAHDQLSPFRREIAGAASIAYYHSKLLTRQFVAADETRAARYGFTYVGSHNMSLNAWGAPSVTRRQGVRFLSCNSYEVGVVLLVPRGTPEAEAEAAFSWAAQPFQFDPHRLVPLDDADLERARDSVTKGVSAARSGGRASTRTELVPEQLQAEDGARLQPDAQGDASAKQAMPRQPQRQRPPPEYDENEQLQAAFRASLGEQPQHQHQQQQQQLQQQQLQQQQQPAHDDQLEAALRASMRQQPPGAATSAMHDEEVQMQWAVEASLLQKLHHEHGSGGHDDPIPIEDDDGDGDELKPGSGDRLSPVDLT